MDQPNGQPPDAIPLNFNMGDGGNLTRLRKDMSLPQDDIAVVCVGGLDFLWKLKATAEVFTGAVDVESDDDWR